MAGKITLDSSRGEYGYCTAERYPQGWSINRYINPDYNPDNPDNFKPVSNDDLADALQKGADAGDPAAQQLIKDAYQAVDALGNATKDLGAAVDGLNDLFYSIFRSRKGYLRASGNIQIAFYP